MAQIGDNVQHWRSFMNDITLSELQAKHPDLMAQATVRGGAAPDVSKWSNAQPTECEGIKFPSKVQRRVYLRLVEMFGKDAIRCDVRMPLLSGSKENSRCLYQTIDFCIVRDGKAAMWIDAKTARTSREWARGCAMFRTSWGDVILWDGIGDLE